jgi:hypothetical protein
VRFTVKSKPSFSRSWILVPLLGFVLSALAIPTSTQATAGINKQINFQGKLTDNNGNIVGDNTYSIRFRIYNDPSADAVNACSANSCLWEETDSVTTTAGLFSLKLGAVNTALASFNFNQNPLYVGVKVGSDTEMTPRYLVGSVPAAFTADNVQGYTPGTGNNNLLLLNSSGNLSIAGNIQTTAGTLTVQGAGVSAFTGNVSAPTFTGTGAVTVSSGGSAALSLDSASNTIQIASNDTTLQHAGSYTIDLNAASATTLTLTNSDASNAASLAVEGSLKTGTLGASGVNGSLVFNSATAGNYTTTLVASSSQAASYSLTLPTAAPVSSGQCLQTSGSATQLAFAACATGGSGVTTVGTIDSQTKSADGAVISGSSIYMQTADAAGGGHTGLVSATTQSFAGDKTFVGAVTVQPTDSTTAFRVLQDAAHSNTPVFNADTTNARVSVGSIGTATGQLYVAGKVPVELTSGGATTAAYPVSVFVSGRYAYVTAYSDNKLQIFDVSNPASPVDVSGGGATTANSPHGVYVAGHYAYVVSASGNKLQVFDVSKPSSPVDVSSGGVATGTGATAVTVSGRYAYVIDANANKLQVFDVGNPNHPVDVSSGGVTTGNYPQSLYVAGRYVYVVDNSGNKLQVFDVSNPTSPTDISSGGVTTGTSPLFVYVSGRYAYVTINGSPGKLQVFDVSNPATPTDVSSGGGTTANTPGPIYVQGRYAYLTNYAAANKFQVFDVSNPASPADVSSGGVSTGSNPSALYVSGRYAYIVDSNTNKLQAFDLGGTYDQQLEAGGAEIGSLQVTNDAQVAGDASVLGGLSVGQSLQVTGNVSLSGQTLVQSSTNSTTAIQVKDSGGASLLTGDTSNFQLNVGGNVNIGSSSGTRLFSDNFESGNFSIWNDGTAGNSLPTIDTTTVHGGQYSEKVNLSSQWGNAGDTFTPQSTVYARAWVNYASGSGTPILFYLTGAGSAYWEVYVSGTQLCIYAASGPMGCSSSGLFTTGTWHQVELKVVIGGTATTGTTGLWLDGTQVITVDGTANNGTIPVDSIYGGVDNGDPNTTATYYIDDVSVATAGNGTAASLNVSDSLHVGGTAAFGNAVVIQPASDLYNALEVDRASGVPLFEVDTADNAVIIGSADNSNPSAGLQVDSSVGSGSFPFNITSNDTSAAAQGVGGGIGFQGSDGTVLRTFAAIQGYHESSTAANYAGALRFLTRPSGGSPTQVMNLSSIGAATFQNSTNSTTAFQVQNTAGASVFRIDTTDANSVTNPGFEVSATGWTAANATAPTRSTSDAWNGVGSGNLNNSTGNTNEGFLQTLPSTLSAPNNIATISWYDKLISGTALTDVIAQYSYDGSGAHFASCTGINTQTVIIGAWTRHVCQISVGGATASNAIRIIQQTAGTRSWNIDGVQIDLNTQVTPYGASSISLNSNIISPISFKNAQDSSSAFQITDAENNNLMNVDTSATNTNNLVNNPSFETYQLQWSAKGSASAPVAVPASTVAPYEGSRSMEVSTTALANDGAKYTGGWSNVSGNPYTISFYARLAATAGASISTIKVGYQADGSTDTDVCTGLSINSSGWARISCTIRATFTVGPSFYIDQSDAVARKIYVDGVTLEPDAGATSSFRNGAISLAGSIINSQLILQNSSNSSNAFQVQNAAGVQVFNISTDQANNLISNPGFEVNVNGWVASGTGSIVRTTNQTYLGVASLKVVSQAAASTGAQFNLTPVVTAASTTYTISFYGRFDSGSTTPTLNIRYSPDGSATSDCSVTAINLTTMVSTGWTRYYCAVSSATAPTTSGFIRIMQTDSTAHTYYVDAVQMEPTTVANMTAYGAGVVTLNGVIASPAIFKSSANSTTAFQIQNAAGTNLIGVDTLNTTVSIGVTGAVATAGNVNIANTTGNATQIVKIGSTSSASNTVLINGGTSTTAIQLLAGAGGTINIGTTSQTTPLNIGNTSASTVTTINGGTNATGAIKLLPGVNGGVQIGATTGTGTLTLGQSTGAENIYIGNVATAAATTHTISIGATNNASTGITAINIGNSNSSSGANTVTIKAGTTTTSTGPAMTLTPSLSTAVCSTLGNATAPTGGSTYNIGDCSTGPTLDYAEMYPVSTDSDYGDIMVTSNEVVQVLSSDGYKVLPDAPKKNVVRLVKSTEAYQSNVVGVMSLNYGDFSSTGIDAVSPADNPKPIALNGHIPVKISPSSAPIAVGDYITTSNDPGKGMKALNAGEVIGKALEAWEPDSGKATVEVFVEQGYYPGPNPTQIVQEAITAYLANSSLLSAKNITVTDTVNTQTLVVAGTATVGNLVVADTATINNLTIQSLLTTQKLTVSSEATFNQAAFNQIAVTKGITLGAADEDPTTGNAVHPITIRFKASKPITAGSVVITDMGAGVGWVTTTNQAGDTRVVGVAATSAVNTGDVLQVAISGTVKAFLHGPATIGQLVRASGFEGMVSTTTSPTSGEIVGKVLGIVSQDEQVLILLTLQ